MNRRNFTVLAGALAVYIMTFSGPSPAGVLANPEGKVVLTVTGEIANKNAGEAAVFDVAMLDSLPKRVTNVHTPWTQGRVSFEGPLGAALLDALGVKGTMLVVKALNDYSAEIPVEDFRKYPVILATKLNGKPMSVRDKGPIFVIYPFDEEPTLYNELYFSRSVWQVTSIEVR